MSSLNPTVSAETEVEEPGPDTVPQSFVEENLTTLAGSPQLPAYTKTRNVREQFQYAFELIGGIPRLAHWAHTNPDKFYALYSKLIPTQVNTDVKGKMTVELSWLNTRDTTGKQSQNAIIDINPTNGEPNVG